jgi:hypothetical protein
MSFLPPPHERAQRIEAIAAMSIENAHGALNAILEDSSLESLRVRGEGGLRAAMQDFIDLSLGVADQFQAVNAARKGVVIKPQELFPQIRNIEAEAQRAVNIAYGSGVSLESGNTPPAEICKFVFKATQAVLARAGISIDIPLTPVAAREDRKVRPTELRPST